MSKSMLAIFPFLSLCIAQAQEPPVAVPQPVLRRQAVGFIEDALQNQFQRAPAAPAQQVVNLGDVVVNVVIAKVLGDGADAELSIAKFGGKEAPPTPRVVTAYRAETRKRQVVVNGETKEQEYTVQVPVTSVVTTKENVTPTEKNRSVAVSTVQAFDLKGNPVSTAEWTKRLATPQHVLLLREPINESNKLNPFYTAILREDTLLLFLKGESVDVRKVVVAYSVKDLAVWSNDGKDFDPTDLIELIKSKVVPQAWVTDATVVPFNQNQSLVVSANQATHEALAKFLRTQREEKAKE